MKAVQFVLLFALFGLALFLAGIFFLAVLGDARVGLNLLYASVIYAGLLILGVVVAFLWKTSTAIERRRDDLSFRKIVFAGKVVNRDTGEWPNDRLVLLFLKGNEIGRAVTTMDEFSESGQGIVDGMFVIEVENTYGLDLPALNALANEGLEFKLGSRGVRSHKFAYCWLDELVEGATCSFPVPSKNIEYVLKSMLK